MSAVREMRSESNRGSGRTVGVQGVDYQTAPDEEKAHQVGMGEGLAVGQNGEQEVQGRRYVLKESDGGKAQPFGCSGENDVGERLWRAADH